MILTILQHTPAWVYVLFAGLVHLGVQRTRSNEIPVWRLLLLPVAMAGFSLFGLVQAFGVGVVTAVVWTAMFVATLAVGWVLPTRHGVRPSSAGTVRVPGSWVPLALMMTIFFVRYAVAVLLAMHPALRVDASFAAAVAAIYGLSSGAFAARASIAWRSAFGGGMTTRSTVAVA